MCHSLRRFQKLKANESLCAKY